MPASVSRLYGAVLSRFVQKSFPVWQRIGLHVTRNHFYEPIPDTAALPDDVFTRKSQLVGLNMRDAAQLSLLETFAAGYRAEYSTFPRQQNGTPHQYYLGNIMFGPVDGEVLYCMVRHFKPSRIFEIGSGNTTYLSAQAILKNREQGHDCELVAHEPYPNPTLQCGFPGLSRLVPRPVQQVPISDFEQLQANDILFIDSSHVLKINSDVQYEFLELLPRIKPGVIVHVHDIFLPTEQPKKWVVEHHRFWNEQYLLQAFLAFNDAFEVLFANHYMHTYHPQTLRAAIPSYDPAEHRPSSFWLRRVR